MMFFGKYRFRYHHLYLIFYLILNFLNRMHSFSVLKPLQNRHIFKRFSTQKEIFSLFNLEESEPTVFKAYNKASQWLSSKGIEDFEDSSRHLICQAANLGTKYSDFTKNKHKKLTPNELLIFQNYCIQRSKSMPIQYIIGNWDFYGDQYICRPPILIPRPETEELVENAIQFLDANKISNPKILDIGAGTGAIGIALAKQIPNARVTAIDLNKDACILAIENAKNILKENQCHRYQCLHFDFLNLCKNMPIKEFSNYFDLIVSNPPYIPSKELPHLQPEVRDFEDSRALDGGQDGLALVHPIIQKAPMFLSPQGTKTLFLEVSRDHPHSLVSYYESNSSIKTIKAINDFTGNPRFVQIIYK